MAFFNYTAIKDNKTLVNGRVEADDMPDARKKVRQMGLIPTSITEDGTAEKKAKNVGGRVSALSLREKIDFTSTLEILTSTGIPIIEALLFIEQNSDSPRIRKITHEFRKQIIGGSTLGETLEKYRNIFGRVYMSS